MTDNIDTKDEGKVVPIKGGEIKRAPGKTWSASTLLDRLLTVLVEETAGGDDDHKARTKTAIFADPEGELGEMSAANLIVLIKDRVIKEAMRGRV